MILHQELKGGMFMRLFLSGKINLEYQAVTVSIRGLCTVSQHSIKIFYACVIKDTSFVVTFCDGSPEQTGRSRASYMVHMQLM